MYPEPPPCPFLEDERQILVSVRTAHAIVLDLTDLKPMEVQTPIILGTMKLIFRKSNILLKLNGCLPI